MAELTIKFVRCRECGLSVLYSTFIAAGAQHHYCRCRPGEEDWVVVKKDVEVSKPIKRVKPPCP